MKSSLLALALAALSPAAADAAAIAYRQAGFISGPAGGVEVPDLDLKPGAYELSVQFGRGVSDFSDIFAWEVHWHDFCGGEYCGGNRVFLFPTFVRKDASSFAASMILNPGRIDYYGADWTEYYPDDYLGGGFYADFAAPAGPNDRTEYSFTIYDLDAVPEPSIWAALIIGFGLAGSLTRRRTAAASTPVM